MKKWQAGNGKKQMDRRSHKNFGCMPASGQRIREVKGCMVKKMGAFRESRKNRFEEENRENAHEAKSHGSIQQTMEEEKQQIQTDGKQIIEEQYNEKYTDRVSTYQAEAIYSPTSMHVSAMYPGFRVA